MAKRDPSSVDRLTAAVGAALAMAGVPVQAVYLHGSWATQEAGARSDVDLAILGEKPLALDDRLTLGGAVVRALGEDRDIDVADLRGVDPVFAAQVVTYGERILTRDRAAAEQFEMLTLAKYARLNEERAGILADIVARGTVYLDSGTMSPPGRLSRSEPRSVP